MRELELLAPAADKHVAREAILHGADAVYMGGPSHGARKKASNSLEDIRETVIFAHQYRARVYVTVNTLVYERELKAVERLVWDLYRIGVDALIVQDISLLRMQLPPIALHASTQCDTRTPEKARFLQEAGFSQIVLARELSIDEIGAICREVTVPVECFIHGALCVSYSGRCAASQVAVGRSANRGECAQMCRMPYTLRNGRGEVVEKDKYLLSLRDFNASDMIPAMIEAGASSFKIEGRLKEADYVKNVTAAYRTIIDRVIAENPDKYRRSSYGESRISFTPQLDKSFNRGFTEYFLHGRRSGSMASLQTPKSMGEIIRDTRELHNGDGISFFNAQGEYEGVGINRVENGRIIGARPFRLPAGAEIHRTLDREWQTLLGRATAERRIAVDIRLTEQGAYATDERGNNVSVSLDCEKAVAKQPMNPRNIFAKLGSTIYKLRDFRCELSPETFIPASQLTAVRRRLIAALDNANSATYRYDKRAAENKEFPYPATRLEKRDNVANSLAEKFYRDHGVTVMEHSTETEPTNGEEIVMTTRYCIRRELGCCQKIKIAPDKRAKYEGPLSITTGPHRFCLRFDCVRCEMLVVREGIKK
jgi:putative protease